MDQISELLASLSPEDMEYLKSLASGLLNGGGKRGGEDHDNAREDHSDGFDPSALSDMLGGDDTMGTLVRLAPVLQSFNQDDDRTELIRAIKPHLSPERRRRADEAMKLLKLIKLLPLIRESGIF